MIASLTLTADSSAYVAALDRATKAAKRLAKALAAIDRTPIVVSVQS